jgi:hypothetical protein
MEQNNYLDENVMYIASLRSHGKPRKFEDDVH